MSFVVLSNNKQEDGITATQGSIDKPYQFRNQLSATYEIPANSEVALQSAKINMDGSIVVGKDNRVFYLWFGQNMSYNTKLATIDDISKSINSPIKVTVSDGTANYIKCNPSDLAPFLELALNKYSYHPQIHDTILVDPKLVAGVFSGYDIQIAQSRIADPQANFIPSTQSAIDAYKEDVRDALVAPKWSWTNGTGAFRVELQTDNETVEAATFNVPPLLNKQAVFQVDITGVVGANAVECCIGLTRDSTVGSVTDPTLVYPGNINIDAFNGILPRFNNLGTPIDSTPDWCHTYMDYGVCFQLISDGAAPPVFQRRLRLYHCVGCSNQNGADVRESLEELNVPLWTIESMDYTVGPGGAALFNYDWATNADNYEKIKFTVDGDVVKVSLIDDRAVEVVLMDYDPTRNKNQNLCPMEQGRWSLFPLLGIYNYENGAGQYDRTLTIDTWNGANTNFSAWSLASVAGNDPATYGWLADPDATWNRRIDGDGDPINGELARRVPCDYGVSGGATSPYLYEGVEQTTPFNYTKFKPNLIVMPSTLFSPSNQASMANVLGFPQTAVAYGSIPDPTDGEFLITSASVPNMVSIKSIFVRLDNFTQQSVNGKMGMISQIIGHLPRHVESNTSNYGPMYLESSNLIYIKLNNPSPIKIQSFDTSLVYLDETFATNLVGTSVICLHFRQSPS